MKDAFFAWSGGKDSALGLYRVLQQQQYLVKYLLTTVNEAHQRVSMHGVRLSLLEQQAHAIGIPLKIVWVPETPSMAEYEALMAEAMLSFKAEGIAIGIFGDIFLEDLRQYREAKLNQVGLQTAFPLWGENTTYLVQTFIKSGFRAKLVCVSDQRLGRSFIGRALDASLLQDLPPQVDPAGENGEYHSFVYDGPIFKTPVSFTTGEIIMRDYAPATDKDAECGTNTTQAYDTRFWFCDLIPEPG
ncbi:Dph6-related ATP pyrophosphatase [Adhaeribacter rhizoryzae]|uniref:Diphthine--ammonia ligase n=1 Tax=Adhaeribacter rhizoryzae TaxID=2607907 RepID=A0A5M6DL87_9BACT|nr:diphthine--ammonia ligase [Adhaeribacter rhizoryzae]KAA5548213.1 diphthine--ammonia ligase [Adhaeribacter rhizoryzae]